MTDSFRSPRIALTGGPCAGKSTSLAGLTEWLSGLGFAVVVSGEAATDFILGGVIPNYRGLSQLVFQRLLLRYVIAKENCFAAALEQQVNEMKVLICDRGAMDADRGCRLSPIMSR